MLGQASQIGTGLLTNKQKLADLPFMLVSFTSGGNARHQPEIAHSLASDTLIPVISARLTALSIHSRTRLRASVPSSRRSLRGSLFSSSGPSLAVRSSVSSSSCRFSALPSIQPRDYRYLRARSLVFRPLDEAESRSQRLFRPAADDDPSLRRMIFFRGTRTIVPGCKLSC